jgi:lipoyl(octanoyl) transferase
VTKSSSLVIRQLGEISYSHALKAMQTFTEYRNSDTDDEIWLLQHPPVFTMGRTGKDEHILVKTNIPVIQTDRGGDITYHGPGQIIAYVLIDLRRRRQGVRQFVNALEDVVIKTLSHWELAAKRVKNRPGVYVGDAKIASIGLRVQKGCSYHGISLNVSMDLSPWRLVKPCGLDIPMTQLSDLIDSKIKENDVIKIFTNHVFNTLSYTKKSAVTTPFSVAD